MFCAAMISASERIADGCATRGFRFRDGEFDNRDFRGDMSFSNVPDGVAARRCASGETVMALAALVAAMHSFHWTQTEPTPE